MFLLRAKQIGLTLDELNELDMGIVNDMFIEQMNDEYDYPTKATQADFDKFRGH